MNSRKRSKQDRIIIFSRYPVPGEVKTRLIPAIDRTGAADLHRRLTEKTLATALSFSADRGAEVEVYYEGGSEPQIRRWLGPDITCVRQRSGDLGQRMRIAMEKAFQQGARRAVIVGADIPDIKPKHFKQAFEVLEEQDLVLGPSTDGGYWLIGSNRPVDIFENISWGAETVIKETITKADRQRLKFKLLEPLTDIDTLEDLKKWRPDMMERRPYISVIIPALNEAANIVRTIRAAETGEAEIIVADGGSSDQTAALASQAGARVIESAKGRAIQQNCGAKRASGSILLFLHADTILPEDYLNLVFEMMMDKRIVLGAFSFKTDLNSRLMKGIEFLTNFRARKLNLPYGDQALFLKKSTFEETGGFPETSIAEDYYLVRRLTRRGRLGIVPASVVTSARRWQSRGLIYNAVINQIMALGFIFRVPPDKLAAMHRFLHQKRQP